MTAMLATMIAKMMTDDRGELTNARKPVSSASADMRSMETVSDAERMMLAIAPTAVS